MTRQEKGEEAPPLRFLRRYSNYLTPKTGLSGDTLAAVATYLRNFGLNLIPLVSIGAAFIFAMYLLAQGTAGLDSQVSGTSTLWLALALIMLAVWGAAAGLATAAGARPDSWAARPWWAWVILIPTVIVVILISLPMMRGDGAPYRQYDDTDRSKCGKQSKGKAKPTSPSDRITKHRSLIRPVLR